MRHAERDAQVLADAPRTGQHTLPCHVVDIAADDVLMGWHGSALGAKNVYVRILKLNKRRIKVRTEAGRQTCTAPHFSSKVSAKEIAKLQADGVSI
jgi:hypothetical protein